jgi:hypothetical protein
MDTVMLGPRPGPRTVLCSVWFAAPRYKARTWVKSGLGTGVSIGGGRDSSWASCVPTCAAH